MKYYFLRSGIMASTDLPQDPREEADIFSLCSISYSPDTTRRLTRPEAASYLSHPYRPTG
jgi:hypothetical protein